MWLVRTRVRRGRWQRGAADAAEDLYREKDEGCVSVYRVENDNEARLLVALHEASGPNRPEKNVDFLKFRFELTEQLGLAPEQQPDLRVFPLLSERHFVICGLGSIEACAAFAEAVLSSADHTISRINKAEMIQTARDYCRSNPQDRASVKTDEWRRELEPYLTG